MFSQFLYKKWAMLQKGEFMRQRGFNATKIRNDTKIVLS
ncbi:hypothetical protein G1C97_0101 [Bifidobacterium sp. DSM 109959]|uniref:Uncharacterized protein n=1 Tax=Bifidobacterium olomucense TaxID=2675324 RepID=A0A7Y0EVG6_9BIFI|nr:hypothetical protein [Bifidobacterium sp. DSM 109959]